MGQEPGAHKHWAKRHSRAQFASEHKLMKMKKLPSEDEVILKTELPVAYCTLPWVIIVITIAVFTMFASNYACDKSFLNVMINIKTNYAKQKPQGYQDRPSASLCSTRNHINLL